MRGTLSAEVRIERGLRHFECSGRNFVELARASGIQVAQSSFALVMSDKGKDFDADTAERLLDLLEQMRKLQEAVSLNGLYKGDGTVFVAIDWSRTERLSTALAYRRLQQVASELGDSRLDEIAKAATTRLE
jgi:hypothetical protein